MQDITRGPLVYLTITEEGFLCPYHWAPLFFLYFIIILFIVEFWDFF